MKLNSDSGDIILINAYLPFHNTRDLQNYKIMYQETIAYIDNVIGDHVHSKFILLLDMNCNIYDTSHPYTVFIQDLMARHSLFSAFDMMSSFDPCSYYTRSDPKTNSFTLIDGILLSKSLASIVVDVRISDFGDNVSDHRPVEIDLEVILTELTITPRGIKPFVNWSNLSSDSIDLFREKMRESLDAITVPFYLILHDDR